MKKIIQFQLENSPTGRRDIVALLEDGTLWEQHYVKDPEQPGCRYEWRRVQGPGEE